MRQNAGVRGHVGVLLFGVRREGGVTAHYALGPTGVVRAETVRFARSPRGGRARGDHAHPASHDGLRDQRRAAEEGLRRTRFGLGQTPDPLEDPRRRRSGRVATGLRSPQPGGGGLGRAPARRAVRSPPRLRALEGRRHRGSEAEQCVFLQANAEGDRASTHAADRDGAALWQRRRRDGRVAEGAA